MELAIEVRPCLAVASGAIALTPPPASPAAPICRLSVHIPRSLSSHHTQISLLFLHPQVIGVHSICKKSNSADCQLITPKVNIFSLHTILHLFLHPQATELHNSTHKKAKQTKGFINSQNHKFKEKLFFSTHLLLNKSSANPDFFLDSMSKAPAILLRQSATHTPHSS